jgi:hypothetical protein
MKKVLSISLSLLMLVAMLNISVAVHYCGGKEFAAKLSLAGKLAHCGMVTFKHEIPLPGNYFTKHCCDDIVILCGISSNYSPTYSFVTESYQNYFQILAVPVDFSAKSQTVINPLYADVGTPGAFMSTDVDLSDICVFRI